MRSCLNSSLFSPHTCRSRRRRKWSRLDKIDIDNAFLSGSLRQAGKKCGFEPGCGFATRSAGIDAILNELAKKSMKSQAKGGTGVGRKLLKGLGRGD